MAAPDQLALEAILHRQGQNLDDNLLQLLESGDYSDCQVRAGRRTWNTHQAILGTRSEWFRDVLIHNNDDPKVIIINDLKVLEVQAALEYIYGRSIRAKHLFEGYSKFETIMVIHKLADKFHLDGLRALALNARDEMAKQQCFNMCRADGGGEIDSYPGLISAIRSLYIGVYANNQTIVQAFLPTYMQMALAGIHIFARDAEFQRLLREVGPFAVDWGVLLMQRIGWRGKPALGGHRQVDAQGVEHDWLCAKCGQAVGVGGAAVEYFGWIASGSMEVLCSKCFAVPTLEQWRGDVENEDGPRVEEGEVDATVAAQDSAQDRHREKKRVFIDLSYDDDDDILEIFEVRKNKNKKRKKKQSQIKEEQGENQDYKRLKMEEAE